MERNTAQDVKVGLFVFVAMALIGVSVWMLGEGGELLEDRYVLNCAFDDVAGLREGAVVRLAGIDVGEVRNIRFSEDLGVKKVPVELSIKATYQDRIRDDSIARIDTLGLVGDKYVSISVGSLDEEPLNDGNQIDVAETVPLVEYQKQATRVAADLEEILAKVNNSLGDNSEANEASVANVISSVESILKEAETGNGLIHALVYDESLTRKLDATVTNLQASSADINDITNEVQTGDGFANELIYGDEGEELANQMGNLAEALETLVVDIENEDSLVHALIYDAERASMVEDLHATATALRAISEGIEQGDGTLGLLAQDPALYEDLRALVNGAERNKLLRYYVRKTVEDGEAEQAPFTP